MIDEKAEVFVSQLRQSTCEQRAELSRRQQRATRALREQHVTRRSSGGVAGKDARARDDLGRGEHTTHSGIEPMRTAARRRRDLLQQHRLRRRQW